LGRRKWLYETALGDILATILNVFMPAIHESYEVNALFSPLFLRQVLQIFYGEVSPFLFVRP